jgi:hypothetical protein
MSYMAQKTGQTTQIWRCPPGAPHEIGFTDPVYAVKGIKTGTLCFFCFDHQSAPDEIRTHIDGTGNHNSIH